MSRFRLLVTKKIKPSLITEAEANELDIDEKEFIKIVPVETASNSKPGINEFVVFTSKNGVTFAAKLYGNASAWKIFCVGGATKDEVSRLLPHAEILGTAPDAVRLAEVMKKNSAVQHVVFFCGDKRRNELPDILKQHGIAVTEKIVYKTLITPVQLDKQADGVAFFSPSAVDSFFTVNNVGEQVVLFSIGNTTATAIKKYSDNMLIITPEPSEESMIATVINYKNK